VPRVFRNDSGDSPDRVVISASGAEVPPGKNVVHLAEPQFRERFEREARALATPEVSRGLWQVSTGGGTRPLWARTSQELFYLSPAGALMRVTFERGATRMVGRALSGSPREPEGFAPHVTAIRATAF